MNNNKSLMFSLFLFIFATDLNIPSFLWVWELSSNENVNEFMPKQLGFYVSVRNILLLPLCCYPIHDRICLLWRELWNSRRKRKYSCILLYFFCSFLHSHVIFRLHLQWKKDKIFSFYVDIRKPKFYCWNLFFLQVQELLWFFFDW